jgi:hypothetical protein
MGKKPEIPRAYKIVQEIEEDLEKLRQKAQKGGKK